MESTRRDTIYNMLDEVGCSFIPKKVLPKYMSSTDIQEHYVHIIPKIHTKNLIEDQKFNNIIRKHKYGSGKRERIAYNIQDVGILLDWVTEYEYLTFITDERVMSTRYSKAFRYTRHLEE